MPVCAAPRYHAVFGKRRFQRSPGRRPARFQPNLSFAATWLRQGLIVIDTIGGDGFFRLGHRERRRRIAHRLRCHRDRGWMHQERPRRSPIVADDQFRLVLGSRLATAPFRGTLRLQGGEAILGWRLDRLEDPAWRGRSIALQEVSRPHAILVREIRVRLALRIPERCRRHLAWLRWARRRHRSRGLGCTRCRIEECVRRPQCRLVGIIRGLALEDLLRLGIGSASRCLQLVLKVSRSVKVFCATGAAAVLCDERLDLTTHLVLVETGISLERCKDSQLDSKLRPPSQTILGLASTRLQMCRACYETRLRAASHPRATDPE